MSTHQRRQAAENLEVRKEMRLAEEAILARAPEHDLEPSLDRIRQVMELTGDVQRTFPAVHVTGTNGKTSTTRMIDALMQAHGLRTGRMTSPHLHHIRERICFSGEPITREAFVAAYADMLPLIDLVDQRSLAAGGPRMTYFEVIVALAYAAFADRPVDVGVVEVGMGGSWDATNVIDAEVAVITPISLDHTHFLGDSLLDIAHEKAGIIKPGATVVCGQQEPEVLEVLRARAEEVGATFRLLGEDFMVEAHEHAVGGQMVTIQGVHGRYPELFIPLFGAHQAENAALALAAVEAFFGPEHPLAPDVVADGAAHFSSPGRLEVVRRSPTIMVDAAHNPGGVEVLARALEESFAFGRLIAVVAIFADKEAEPMLEALEKVCDEVVVTTNSSPRSMPAGQLGELAAEIWGGHRVTVQPVLSDALETAVALADEGGVGGGIIATGSVITAADVRALCGKMES